MKKGQDLIAEFPGLTIIHQKIPGRELGRHQHDEHEFFLPLQGEITLNFDGKIVCGGPGRLIYAPPNLEHSFSSSAQGEGERVIFLIRPTLWKKLGGASLAPAVVPASSLVRELIFFLLLNPETKGVAHFISALVNALSDHISAMGGHYSETGTVLHLSGKIQDARIKKAIDQLQEIGNQPAMTELARKSGLSVRNFNRLFSEETGMTPKQYSTILLVEKAKSMLAKTSLTITDISQEVGYQSLSKFIATFQRHTGQLPSEYREYLKISLHHRS
jgi:AraC-like DNA-binding protein